MDELQDKRRFVDIDQVVPMEYGGEPRDRLTATLSMVHQHSGERPVHVQGNFTASLSNIIQPVERRLIVGTAWKPIDLGWFADQTDKIGYVEFENAARVGLLVNPTDEEREDLKNQILWIAFAPDPACEEPDWIVRPGRFHVGEPGPGFHECHLRAADKPLPIRYTIFPAD